MIAVMAGFWIFGGNSVFASGGDEEGGERGVAHKKFRHGEVKEYPVSTDRMSRHERQVVRARLAAVHRAQEKRFNTRAFDRDFDRISERFGSANDAQPSSDNGQENGNRTLPSGTQLRDARTGQVFFVP